jgi:hypothetical protein
MLTGVGFEAVRQMERADPFRLTSKINAFFLRLFRWRPTFTTPFS